MSMAYGATTSAPCVIFRLAFSRSTPREELIEFRPNFRRNSPLILWRRDATIANAGRRIGGERGIRTLEGLLTLTPLAGVRLRPLGHLSGGRNHNEPETGWQRNAQN